MAALYNKKKISPPATIQNPKNDILSSFSNFRSDLRRQIKGNLKIEPATEQSNTSYAGFYQQKNTFQVPKKSSPIKNEEPNHYFSIREEIKNKITSPRLINKENIQYQSINVSKNQERSMKLDDFIIPKRRESESSSKILENYSISRETPKKLSSGSGSIKDKLDSLKKNFERGDGLRDINKSNSHSNLSNGSIFEKYSLFGDETKSKDNSNKNAASLNKLKELTTKSISNNTYSINWENEKKSRLSEILPIDKIIKLQDLIVDVSDKEFDNLARRYVEELIKLSSIITHKVKGSSHYTKA